MKFRLRPSKGKISLPPLSPRDYLCGTCAGCPSAARVRFDYHGGGHGCLCPNHAQRLLGALALAGIHFEPVCEDRQRWRVDL